MATPISYGLVLEGEDAKDFDDYMANPQFSEVGLASMRRVILRRRAEGKED